MDTYAHVNFKSSTSRSLPLGSDGWNGRSAPAISLPRFLRLLTTQDEWVLTCHPIIRAVRFVGGMALLAAFLAAVTFATLVLGALAGA